MSIKRPESSRKTSKPAAVKPKASAKTTSAKAQPKRSVVAPPPAKQESVPQVDEFIPQAAATPGGATYVMEGDASAWGGKWPQSFQSGQAGPIATTTPETASPLPPEVKKYAAMRIDDLIPPDARAAVVRYPGTSPSHPQAHFDTPQGRRTAVLVPGAVLVYTAYDSQSDEGVYFSLVDGKARAAHLYGGGYYFFDEQQNVALSDPDAIRYDTAYAFLKGLADEKGTTWIPANTSLQNLLAAGRLPQQASSGVETLFEK
jgi:hypothetical protein